MASLAFPHHRPSPPSEVLRHPSALSPSASRSRELFRSLFERSGVAVAVLDGRCRIQCANIDLLSLLDRDTAETTGLNLSALLPPECGRRLLTNVDRLRTGQEQRFGQHVRLARPDGGVVECYLKAVPVQISGAAPATIAILLRRVHPLDRASDVTGSKVLSAMDARILEGVAAGASTVQLAGKLYLSRQGVEYHVGAMLRRLKAPNRAALISRAYEVGILTAGIWPPRANPQFVG